MTTRDDIPPCSCADLRGKFLVDYKEGNVGCQRHPNSSLTGNGPPPPSKPTSGNHPNSLATLDHWHDVHAEEWQRRKHVRDDEEPEQKAWRHR
jgi:hypothetical protein